MFREGDNRFVLAAVCGGLLVLSLLTLVRLSTIFREELFIDFWAYYDVSQAICKGLNPYFAENLTTRTWGDIPIVFPGYALLFSPFLLFSIHIASLLFLVLNIGLGVAIFVYVYKWCIYGNDDACSESNPMHILSFLLFLIYLNSSPFLMTLRHGQSTILIGCCLFGVLMFKSSYAKYLCFAVCACLKYSVLPFIAFGLFFKGRYKLCIVSFSVFLFMSVCPLFFGVSLLELYRSYVDVLSQQMQNGFNTFAVSGYNMLQFDLFRFGVINLAVKIIFVLIGIYIIYLEARQASFSLELLLVLSSITMLLSYNRLYNLAFVVLILAVELTIQIRRKQCWHSLIIGGWLVLFLIPFSLILKGANYLGRFAFFDQFFYLGRFGDMQTIFPIMPIVMLILCIYSIILYFSIPREEQINLDNREQGRYD